MRHQLRWIYAVPAIGVALVLGLAVAAFTSGGSVLGNESDDPFVDDGSALVNEATISLDDAIAAARSVASGPLDNEVDMERLGDRIVYEIEVGDTEVKVDALDGSIIATDMNDDAGDDDLDDDDEDGDDD